jgi:hypothetical protein
MCLFMISSTADVATRSAYQPSKYSADRGFGRIGSLYIRTEHPRCHGHLAELTYRRSGQPRPDTNNALGKRRW